MTWQEVGDGIFRRRYVRLDQNIGVILGSESLCVIDSRSSHLDADELRAELSAFGRRSVRWLVNTHMHWDHTFGNARFDEAAIVGHSRCRTRLLDEGERVRSELLEATWMPEEMRASFADVRIVPPELTFDDRISIHVDDRRVDLRHLGRGHTDNDVVVTVDGVCFAGDLVEEGAPPSFGDSYPDEWVRTLDDLLGDLAPVVVPGHGDLVDPDFVRDQRDQIAAAIDHLRHGTGDAPWSDAVMESVGARLG